MNAAIYEAISDLDINADNSILSRVEIIHLNSLREPREIIDEEMEDLEEFSEQGFVRMGFFDDDNPDPEKAQIIPTASLTPLGKMLIVRELVRLSLWDQFKLYRCRKMCI